MCDHSFQSKSFDLLPFGIFYNLLKIYGDFFRPMGYFIRRIPIRFIDIVAGLGLAISREGIFLK